MDMDFKKMDYTTLKLFCNHIIQNLPSQSPQVGANKLHTVLDVMLKKMRLQSDCSIGSGQHRTPR